MIKKLIGYKFNIHAYIVLAEEPLCKLCFISLII